tara:strand:+ start:1358 stop:1798 length:441 start_codon:yes stop_codon:yes gene_type:complete
VAHGGQYVREPVEGIVAKPFPPFHEKGGREDLGRRELVQPQEELHVGVLPDDTNGLIVAQAQFVLDDQAADHDPRVDGRPSAFREAPGIDLCALVPWKMGGQLYPPVAGIKFHLVKIAEFLNFELVLGGALYHMQSICTKLRNNLH